MFRQAGFADWREWHIWRFRLIVARGDFRGQSALQWSIFGVDPPLYRTLFPLSKSLRGCWWFHHRGFKPEDYQII
jgi:hypothetical protein